MYYTLTYAKITGHVRGAGETDREKGSRGAGQCMAGGAEINIWEVPRNLSKKTLL